MPLSSFATLTACRAAAVVGNRWRQTPPILRSTGAFVSNLVFHLLPIHSSLPGCMFLQQQQELPGADEKLQPVNKPLCTR